jgi:hypothetical protein
MAKEWWIARYEFENLDWQGQNDFRRVDLKDMSDETLCFTKA